MGIFDSVLNRTAEVVEGAATTIIGEGAEFRGNITAKGTVRINGDIEGGVISAGDVLVGERGKVRGDVSGRKLVVSGEVYGNITASGGLEITRNGKVYGDITGDKLTVDEGAVFQGKVKMDTSRTRGTVEPAAVKSEGNTSEDFTSRIYNTIKGMNKE